jgi:predicted  nucleic acid-binding Zn-ribbon protein
MIRESQDDKEAFQMKMEDLERKLKESNNEVNNIKSEFQSYKVRANAALQKSSQNSSGSKIVELEHEKNRLLREKLYVFFF